MFDPWLLDVISKHARRGVLVDANLLFIYSLGILDPALISKIDGAYSAKDFVLLDYFLGGFDRIITTPIIMTEVSNLAPKRRKDIGVLFHELLRTKLLKVIDEKYVVTSEVVTYPACARLGIADAAAGMLADQQHLVVTNDLDLSLFLHSRSVNCIHYSTSLRPLLWNRN